MVLYNVWTKLRYRKFGITLFQRNLKTNSCRWKALTIENLNPNVRRMEYAVRGPLVARAGDIEKELLDGVQKPFASVLKANVGDCHAMGQTPNTFLREVLSVVINPLLMNDENIADDAKSRAQVILKACRGGSAGSYTDSPGIEIIRRHVAKYIEKRDDQPCDWKDVILCAGASDGIKSVLKLLICPVDGKPPGILVPIPQYPLYSATLAEYGLFQIGYFLNEETGWGLDLPELDRAIQAGRKKSHPRAIVVINPGNPTGQVLTRENIESIIKFAHKENLLIFADEVYQHNIYDEKSEFFSFKKVLIELGNPYNKVELASFMSVSKGYVGECGLRGGYSEIINLDPEVKMNFLKSISAALCPTTIGQSALDVIVNPPNEDEPSYDRFIVEKCRVLGTLKERAKLVHKTFNEIEGFSCNIVQGAMYAFPKFAIPQKAMDAAKAKNQAADVFYAFELLENTGICIIAGTGFGQKPDTFHFRTTILPETDMLIEMLASFKKFHGTFLEKYK